MLFSLNGAEMLTLSQLSSHNSWQDVLTVPMSSDRAVCAKGDVPPVRSIGQIYLQKNAGAWQLARQKALTLARDAGMTLEQFASWNGFDLAVDFYRLRNADELALRDISAQRLREYHLLTRTLAHSLPDEASAVMADSDFETIFRLRFGSIFSVIDKYLRGGPSRNFHLNSETGEISAR
jgi:hypothetical protein